MVRISYLNREYLIEELEWKPGAASPDELDKMIVEFFQDLTDPNTLSGADPIPDLAIANQIKEKVKGMKIVSFDQPEFDPEAIY